MFSEDELLAITKIITGGRDRAIFDMLLDSGMRLSELAGIDMKDISEDCSTIKVYGKGGKERQVFLDTEAAASVTAYLVFDRPEPRRGDRLFLTVDGYPLTAIRIQKILEIIGKKAGLQQRLSPHKLRHTYATWSLRNGANLEYVRRTLGHTDIKTTEIYLHLSNRDIKEAHRTSSPVSNIQRKINSRKTVRS